MSNSFINQNKHRSIRGGESTRKLQLVDSIKPEPTNPTPPSAARFIPKHDKEAWADVWLRGVKNLPQLTHSNRGFGLLCIEDAVRQIVLEKLARAERLERNVMTMTRRRAA